MDAREIARLIIPAHYEGEGWNKARDRAEAEIRELLAEIERLKALCTLSLVASN